MKTKIQSNFIIVLAFSLLILISFNVNAQVTPYPVNNNTSCVIKINYECYCPGANPPTNVCGSGTGIIISANSIIWIKCTCTLSVCVGSDLLISLVEVNGNPVSCGCSVSGSNPNGTYPASACSFTPSPAGTIIWNLTGTTFN